MDVFEEFFGSQKERLDNEYLYPKAGLNANPYIKKAIKEFHKLPNEAKENKPLLYWLLGSGTPPYKMSKKDSEYQGKPFRGQNCGNCRFTFMRWTNKELICSQIAGNIELDHWCKLWMNSDDVVSPLKKD